MKTIAITKNLIKETDTFVRTFSFEEKKQPLTEDDRNNRFLDAILHLKSILTERTQKINDLVEKMEGLTWLSGWTEDHLRLLNGLIASARDLHSVLIRKYVGFKALKKKDIAKKEIKELKSAIDNLRDVCQDLESTFFYLPAIPGYLETTREITIPE